MIAMYVLPVLSLIYHLNQFDVSQVLYADSFLGSQMWSFFPLIVSVGIIFLSEHALNRK